MLEKLLLAAVQGITEFLPVSSSGHLVFLRHLMGVRAEGAFYEVFLHSATFLSVVFVLREEIFDRRKFIRYFKLSLIASLPLFILAPFKDILESTFENPSLLPLTFFITSLFLLSTPLAHPRRDRAGPLEALVMGVAQSLALLPGVSRSGTTISTGLHRGLKPEEAFTLSFWMFLPAALGSFILETPEVRAFDLSYADALAWFVAFSVGVLSLKLLKRILLGRFFWIFGIYTLAMALTSLVVFT